MLQTATAVKGMRFKHGAYYHVNRFGKWTRLGTDEPTAVAACQQLSSVQYPLGTIGYLIERYMQEVVPGKAPRTQKDNQAEHKILLAHFGNKPVEGLEAGDVGAYLRSRAKDGAAIRGNRERALLSHIFTMAMEWKLAKYNPCLGVRRNPEHGRSRYISDAEFDAVLGIANPVVRDIMQIGVATALRISDILEIEVTDITPEGIMCEPNKTMRSHPGKTLLIKMSPTMEEVVARRLPDCAAYLFERHDGKRRVPYSYKIFGRMFARTVTKALSTKLIKESFTFHDIRAKALTDASRMGMNAQLLAGHSNPMMTARYIKRREIEVVAAVR
jgi:integrase